MRQARGSCSIPGLVQHVRLCFLQALPAPLPAGPGQGCAGSTGPPVLMPCPDPCPGLPRCHPGSWVWLGRPRWAVVPGGVKTPGIS